MLKKRVAMVWYKMTDLRIHDHEALFQAHNDINNEKVCHIFCFDKRFTNNTTSFGISKMSGHRSRFLIESVADLQKNLQKRGSDLLILVGKPEIVLPQIAKKYNCSALYTHCEICSEELNIQIPTIQALQQVQQDFKINEYWGNTMYSLKDLPYTIEQMPKIFTQFRKSLEENPSVNIRNPMEEPKFKPNIQVQSDDDIIMKNLPSDYDLFIQESQICDIRSVLNFKGGETEAIKRLNDYFWDKDLLKVYKETRNGMLGADYSSKFSPWLSLGCLSPRYIVAQIKIYEKQRVSNESTYWLIFELLWRDYFKFHALQQGNKIFHLYGTSPSPQKKNWSQDMKLFDLWRQGNTGFPLIDANMRELKLSGFMSNRGRQIVASFLVRDLNLDWRMGAQHFEAYLLDHDPTSNYGNWNYSAGVGCDPREDRYFNIVKQAKNYDPQCHYMVHWCPELSKVPNWFIIEPYKMSYDDRLKYDILDKYPQPCIELLHTTNFNNKMNQKHGTVPGQKNQDQQWYQNNQQIKQQSQLKKFETQTVPGIQQEGQKKKRIRHKKQDNFDNE